ncbi:major facilitator superfamily domain-containing protein 6 [Arctopsyche grandis]|uniref:major facilitator superfamily domain-containing protein 6 n=1 Tax=Arctopsyche grandis TaxID=121162 RepID=UPI00406DA338
MLKINKELLPIKAHFFLFFAAMGPLLPQMPVYGKQLGISPDVMGLVTAVLPILWALAKPAIGFLVDYFHSYRKFVFMCLVFSMSASYFCIYFLPEPQYNNYIKSSNITTFRDFPNDRLTTWIYLKPCDTDIDTSGCSNNSDLYQASCGWICKSQSNTSSTGIADSNVWNFWIEREDMETGTLTALYYETEAESCGYFNMNDYNDSLTGEEDGVKCIFRNNCRFLSCAFFDARIEDVNLTMGLEDDEYLDKSHTKNDYNLYTTITFWGFVIFMCTGTVGYNVANCIGDAVCLDVLGPENGMKYGFQRAWGTAGYGLTALLSGLIVDYVSGDQPHKDFTPAFILMAAFTLVDLYFCRKLELPSMTRPVDAGGTLMNLFKQPPIFIFVIFAIVVGILDSFIIYYMLWFMEDVAIQSNNLGNIKFLEGLTIAVESFGGEILFFAYSGKILKYLGFQHTLSLGLFCYGLRLLSISLITQPWHFVLVEMFLQGPTYALCYATIVGYAASVAPPGLSATLQGILAGMDDGVGFCIGSLIGGLLYNSFGGKKSFLIMSLLAFAFALIHVIVSFTIADYNKKVVNVGDGHVVEEELKELRKKPDSSPIDTNGDVKLNTNDMEKGETED